MNEREEFQKALPQETSDGKFTSVWYTDNEYEAAYDGWQARAELAAKREAELLAELEQVKVHNILLTEVCADVLDCSDFSAECPNLYKKFCATIIATSEQIEAYKQELIAKRERALDELAAQAQELNMGYEIDKEQP